MINFKQPVSKRLGILVVLLTFTLALGVISLDFQNLISPSFSLYRGEGSVYRSALLKLSKILFPKPLNQPQEIKQFVSEEDFQNYIKLGRQMSDSAEFTGMDIFLKAELIQPVANGMGSGSAERVSETTVQVIGIDEPDIVKTDGKEIYFSKEGYGWWDRPLPMMEEGISFEEQKMIAPEYQSKISLIKAFPPADLKVDAEIEKNGNLLLTKDILVVFSNQEIFGFDVSDSKNAVKKWDLKLNDNVWLVGARLKGDKIYIVTQASLDEYHPCLIEILKTGTEPLNVRCQDIYHPINPIPVDTVFTAIILDPMSGLAEKDISFVGSTGSSVVYMSPESIFVTYSYSEDTSKFLLNFIKEKARDLYPLSVIEKIEKLISYDISQQAKMMELQIIIDRYQGSLGEDERLRFDNELANRMQDYLKKHQRELEKTGIVKINLSEFNVSATGSVPGYPLNQFSLDEYQNHLRIAVTVGQRWRSWGFGSGSGETANDVYVLDENLKITGSIQDLGLTEKIYSARFIEDKSYLVTFREIDPFYVLDLSNPSNPQMKGQLKIPGYSSYLQPITKDKILGIGKEDSQVKVSLFDVSSASDPKEIAKYVLDEGWSDVLSTHHAFLLDTKHEIFFLPGSRGGYIFSYQGDNLELKKAVSTISARRAIYLDDYLYIIGDNEIIVLNELDWTRVGELNL